MLPCLPALVKGKLSMALSFPFGLHLKRNEPGNQDGREKLPCDSLQDHQRPRHRMNRHNVAVAERRQGNETEIEKMRLHRFYIVWSWVSLDTERPGNKERRQIIGQGPYQPKNQVGGDCSHDTMGS